MLGINNTSLSMLFQKNILKKYIASLPEEKVSAAWEQYKSYFLNFDIQTNIRQSKEEQFQEGFLSELFVKVLGYTLNPSPNYNLITEQKNETNAQKADGAILVDGSVVGVIELKDHKTTDLSKIEKQAFGYKNQHKNATYVIISNFERLRFYIDDATEHWEFDLFHLTEDEFRVLYLCLAYENIATNVPKRLKTESVSHEDAITNALYKDYTTFKRVLFEDILKNNYDKQEIGDDCSAALPHLSMVELYKKTQKLLDRLLFIFFAEDSGLLPPNTMLRIIAEWEKLTDLDEYRPLYERIKKYFGYLDTGYKGKDYEIFAYNGGLFKPDEVLDSLRISDDVLAKHTRKLAEYDYQSEVDVNILGHIFENSLNEIETVGHAPLSEQAPSSSVNKRKKDGVFYTPQYITKYIVENTVGRLCTEKKAELGIDENEYFSDKKRKTDTKKILITKLDQYRQWLLQISICDPACGSGAFLNAALQFLIAEHGLIDKLEAKVTGSDIVFPNVENAILENNLYGVDINEESVEIAKLALWLRTAKPHRKLNSLNNNIKCGNSLISDPAVAGAKAFDWAKEFPQVFAKGGFDVVIGNPPYVTRGIGEDVKTFINDNYETAEYQLDLYVCFMEKSVNLISQTGIIGFIVPNSWLKNMMMSKCRLFMLNKCNVTTIVRTTNVFTDASVDTIVYISDKNISNDNKTAILDFISGTAIFSHEISQQRFYGNNNYIFDIETNDTMSAIFAKMKKDVAKIGELFDVCRGINPYDKYTGQSPEIISNKAYHADYKKDETFVPLLQGRHIDRYSDFWDEKSYISYGDWLAAPREPKYFTGERIVFREIIGKTLISTILTHDIKIDRSLYIAIPLDQDIDIYYVDGILNSTLMAVFFRYTNNEFDELFPKMRVAEFRDLPIKLTDAETQRQLSELVKSILQKSSTLQEKKSLFVRRLQQNLAVQKVTAALENFYTLDFAAFSAELRKQKVSLSLTQQDEWEPYFNKYREECLALKAEIDKTDKEIDSRVYELYGLTEEEVAVIEN